MASAYSGNRSALAQRRQYAGKGTDTGTGIATLRVYGSDHRIWVG